MNEARASAAVRGAKVGDLVAGYVLKDAVGEGGMGRVFLAHDERLDRHVALKLLPPGEADDEARGRFLREARALARVDHPNVVRVNASGVEGELAWMSLEYIEGDPLDAVLAAGPLDEETALLLAAQAARGLAAVHRVGVVHRDVKPGNLLIDDAGTLRVVDFGVALLTERAAQGGFVTQKGVAVGTPHFMAPEQARGGAVGTQVDAWGLGATLFTMLAGQPPFFTTDDEADLEILARVLREKPPDIRKKAPGVSAETAAMLRRLLASDPGDRPADLDEVAALLEACADHLAGRGPLPHIAPLPGPERDPEPAPSESASGEDDARSARSTDESTGAPDESPLSSSGLLPRLAFASAVVFLAAGAGGVGWLLAQNQRPTELDEPSTPPATLAGGEPQESAPAGEDEPAEDPLGDRVAVVDDTLPTPEEIEAREADALKAAALTGGESAQKALARLVELRTAPAEAAVYELVSASPRAADTLAVIDAKGARHHLRTLTWAVTGGEKPTALLAVRALTGLKNTEALEVLSAAENGHPDAEVRDAARKGRRSIFSVEGEDGADDRD